MERCNRKEELYTKDKNAYKQMFKDKKEKRLRKTIEERIDKDLWYRAWEMTHLKKCLHHRKIL